MMKMGRSKKENTLLQIFRRLAPENRGTLLGWVYQAHKAENSARKPLILNTSIDENPSR